MDASRTTANRLSNKVIYFLYRSFLALTAPLVPFYALARVLRRGAYLKTLSERLGFLPQHLRYRGGGAIWIHAVSVGEVMAAGTLIGALRQSFTGPVFVSTSTLAGYQTAGERLGTLATAWFYAPADYASVLRRVLRALQPSIVVVLETEIWPNLFREAKRAGCGLLMANGRISDRAFPAYRRNRWFFRGVLNQADLILAQNGTMRERFVAAGAEPARVEVSGNLKFDFEAPVTDAESPVARWIRSGTGPVLIAASTTADETTDEDRAVLEAFAQLPEWRLILAPRKPERFHGVAQLVTKAGFAYWRRSAGAFRGGERVLLLDTMGELSALFPLADVVFMGGTLTATDGHNFLEPAFAAKSVIVGPRLENFRDIAEDFRAHRAFIEIDGPGGLADAMARALEDKEIGQRARERALANRGATRITADHIERLYANSLFRRVRSLPARMIFRPLAEIWKIGSRRRLASGLRKQRSLEAPVISVGNITVGGTGKTPFVLYLARHLLDRGFEPVALSRGYGRVSPYRQLVVKRGGRASVLHTGDEPQILLRSGAAGLGVGSDRFRVGREAERELNPDVFLLDDGFSHVRLKRDLDIVLIDSHDPFGDGEPVPLGRLREPLDSLSRADLFILTRCAGWRPYAVIERTLRGANPRAPIFRSRIVPRGWVSALSNEPAEPPQRVVAFCGLGNPRSFWRSLEALGIQPLDRLEFEDHHQYAPRELRAVARYARSIQAEALLTTEKDVVNFPEQCGPVFENLPVLWLRAEVVVENEAALLEIILRGKLDPGGIRSRPESDRRPAPDRP